MWHEYGDIICNCADGKHDIRACDWMTAEYANVLETRVARAEAKAALYRQGLELVAEAYADADEMLERTRDALDQGAQEETT